MLKDLKDQLSHFSEKEVERLERLLADTEFTELEFAQQEHDQNLEIPGSVTNIPNISVKEEFDSDSNEKILVAFRSVCIACDELIHSKDFLKVFQNVLKINIE